MFHILLGKYEGSIRVHLIFQICIFNLHVLTKVAFIFQFMHAVADICSEFENLNCDQGCTLGDDDKASCFCDTGYSLASDNQTCVGEFFGFYCGYSSYKAALGI